MKIPVSFGPWRILVTALVTGAFALLGWSLLESNNLSKVKVDNTEFVQHEIDNREDFRETQQILRTQQKELTHEMGEIKNLIIDLHGRRPQ